MIYFSVVITQNIDSQVVPVSTSNTYGTPVSISYGASKDNNLCL